MYDYVTKELPSLLSFHFAQLDTSKASIFGHSMGGHGALTLFLKNPSKYKVLICVFSAFWSLKSVMMLVCQGATCFSPISYRLSLWIVILQSVSAFAPICNPTECPWGNKAFKGYLGEDKATWEVRTKKRNYPLILEHILLSFIQLQMVQLLIWASTLWPRSGLRPWRFSVNMIEVSSNTTWLLGGSWLFCIHCLPCLVRFGTSLEVCWRFGWRTS